MCDIHGEFYRSNPEWLTPLPEDVDVLVLAGDIHIGKAAIELVSRVSVDLRPRQLHFCIKF